MIRCQRCERDEDETAISDGTNVRACFRFRLCHDCSNDMNRALVDSPLEARAIDLEAHKLCMAAYAVAGRPEPLSTYIKHCQLDSDLNSDVFNFLRDFVRNTKPE